MRTSTIAFRGRAMVFLFLAVLVGAFANASLAAQTTKAGQVAAIRDYYLKVNAELKSYTQSDVTWNAGEAYWNNTDYTGYFNSSDELVLLKFSHGEEGYWANYEYYFKDEKIMFVFIYSGEPDGAEKQERVYFWNDRIVEALVKEKDSEDARDIAALPNKPYNEVLNNISKYTTQFQQGVDSEVDSFNEAQEQERAE